MPLAWDYDAAILGGGPAGSAAAAAIARAGGRALVLERESFPRFHIGESLMPQSNEVFEALGLSETVARAGFVEKRGASFLLADGDHPIRLGFDNANGVREPRTFNVDRARFDQLLLDHAEAQGAEVRMGARVGAVNFGERAVEVCFSEDNGAEQTVSARVVIDASGRAGVVARSLGLRRPDPELRKTAIYAHYRGVAPLQGVAAGDVQILSRGDLGWYWAIPIAPDRTSIGVVFDASESEPGCGPEERLDAFLASSPYLRRRMTAAERIGPVHAESDYSYSAARYAGERFLLAGDAGSFLDPIFSTGVYFALRSGLQAGQAVTHSPAHRTQGALQPRAARRFDRAQAHRYRFFRRLIRAFYTPAFRDVFLRPERWPAGVRAINTVLAGHDRPSVADRLRLEVFFGLVAAQERVTLVPRLHAAVRTRPDPTLDDLAAQRSH